jgi:hypothetical protein
MIHRPFAAIGILIAVAMLLRQDPVPPQPHTEDPAQCTRYCYPKGGPATAPKGTPEGIPGYACEGETCSHINEPTEGEDKNCTEHTSCMSWCAKNCCTCLKVCL